MGFLIGGLFFGLYILANLLIGTLINAWLLGYAIRIVCKRRYAFSRACSVSLKLMLATSALQILANGYYMAVPEAWYLPGVVAFILIGLIMTVLMYAYLIESRRGGGIGLKRGLWVTLVQIGFYVLFMIPFVLLGLLIGIMEGDGHIPFE